jgi:membrane protein implicated in regulation of membrane protease activity
MLWFLAIVVVLALAIVFNVGLLACAMAALLGLMLISRFLARSWINNLDATRDCNRLEAEAGQSIAFVVTVSNNGGLPVAGGFV